MPGLHTSFRQGDLVFGLFARREKYSKQLEGLGFSNVYANSLNMPLVRDLMDGKFSPEYIRTLKPYQRKYAKLLEYNKEYLFRSGGKDPTGHVDEKEKKFMIAIRRACKLLIWSAAHSKRRSIHFILDGVDHRRVTSKLDPLTGIYDPAISGSELRQAYRDRDAAFSFVERPSFFFYKEKAGRLELVPPPWEDPESRAYYHAYKPIA
jgi:hypothetical protein